MLPYIYIHTYASSRSPVHIISVALLSELLCLNSMSWMPSRTCHFSAYNKSSVNEYLGYNYIFLIETNLEWVSLSVPRHSCMVAFSGQIREAESPSQCAGTFHNIMHLSNCPLAIATCNRHLQCLDVHGGQHHVDNTRKYGQHICL